jgi:hypothetical protein
VCTIGDSLCVVLCRLSPDEDIVGPFDVGIHAGFSAGLGRRDGGCQRVRRCVCRWNIGSLEE